MVPRVVKVGLIAVTLTVTTAIVTVRALRTTPVPAYSALTGLPLTFRIRSIEVQVPSWASVESHSDALFWQIGSEPLKLDLSVKAEQDCGGSISRWQVKHWVWERFWASGEEKWATYSSWEYVTRRTSTGVAFVAFHPFGAIFWGEVRNPDQLREVLRDITLLKRG
jgi:hypothetical protein